MSGEKSFEEIVIHGDGPDKNLLQEENIGDDDHLLEFLGQSPPQGLRSAGLAAFWRWAIANWDARHLPPRRLIKQH